MTWAVMGMINVAMELQLGHPQMAIGRKGLARALNMIFEGISSKERKKKGEYK